MKKVRKAIIPAAGLGTRFLPATKAMAKEMLPILDKPTIQFIVEESVKSGIEEIIIITSQTKNSIMDHFDYSYELEERLIKAKKEKEFKQIREIADLANIHYIRQKEPLGLGHAILCAKNFISNEPFAVLLGDDIVMNKENEKPALLQCIEAYEKTGFSVVGVQRVPKNDVNKYGIIDIKEDFKNDHNIKLLNGMIEKPSIDESPSDYAILGRYVLSPKIFDFLEKADVDIRGEIEITNAIASLCNEEKVYAMNFSGKRYDIGSKIGYAKAMIDQALKQKDTKEEILKYILEIAKNN